MIRFRRVYPTLIFAIRRDCGLSSVAFCCILLFTGILLVEMLPHRLKSVFAGRPIRRSSLLQVSIFTVCILPTVFRSNLLFVLRISLPRPFGLPLRCLALTLSSRRSLRATITVGVVSLSRFFWFAFVVAVLG